MMTIKRDQQRRHDAERGTRTQRGYTNRWDRARKKYLREHPLCVYCERLHRVTLASVVDHVIPHHGDSKLFWDQKNWQPLCEEHHNATKKREEFRGAMQGCDADGIPLDPHHRWNAQP